MRSLWIVNPHSTRIAKRGARLSRLSCPKTADLFQLKDFTALPACVQAAARNRVQHVFIEAGDGSIQAVLSAFLAQVGQFETFPAFTLIAGGMTNQIARHIGIHHSRRLKALVQGAPAQQKLQQLLQIEVDGQFYCCGFLLSTGAVPMVTDYTKQYLHTRGIGGSLAILIAIIHAIARYPKTSFISPTQIFLKSIETPDDLENSSHLASLVTTLPGLMLNINPFLGTETAPLRVVFIHARARKLVRHLLKLWLHIKPQQMRKDGIMFWNTHTLDYIYDGPVILDGEKLAMPTQFQVRASAPVRFLC